MRRTALAAASVALTLLAVSAGGCTSDDDAPVVAAATSEPAPAGLRRLRARQYVNSVRQIFGDAAAAAADPPVDISLSGYSSIGAAQIAMPPADVERYEASALAVSTAAVSDAETFAALVSCTPSAPDDRACFETLIADVGRVAWRRALADDEVAAIADVAIEAARSLGSFQDGAIYAVSALLQAPDFLYIVELGQGQGDGARALTATELVTRMSFFLTDTTPSASMLDAADAGELESVGARRGLAAELLQRREAKATLQAFFTELYRLDRVDSVPKNTDIFPEWSSALGTDMRVSLLALIDDIAWTRDTDMRELLTADYAFVNDRLAPIYALDPALFAVDGSMRKMELPADQQRNGILGQAAFLTAGAIESRESAVKRGVLIRLQLLCESVPPPPPDVVVELPQPEAGETMKQRLELHQETPACASCHAAIDGLGYPLQIYDALGRYRTEENGQAIDTSGDVPGVGPFADVAELARLLHDDARLPACIVRNLYRHALGHAEQPGQEETIAALTATFASAGYRLQALLIEMASSGAFSRVGPAK